MNDKPVIIAALAIFIVLATFPIWYTLGFEAYSSKDASLPDLELPEGQCVQDVEWMRANHMSLLLEWRDDVVRRADTSQIEINGKTYPKSLTRCCMKCHDNRETFCYRCHAYANVTSLRPMLESATAGQSQRGIRCWGCHVEPKGG